MCQCTEQDKWQEFISRGNTEFSLQYFGNAILMYTQALDDARSTYKTMAGHSHDRAISKVVICYFNLADCYIKLKQIDRACDFYMQAQQFLIRISENTESNSAEGLKAINHADTHINTVWMDFVRKYRDELDYDRMLKYHQSSLLLKNESVENIQNVTLH